MTYQEIYEDLLQKLSEYHPSNDFTLVKKAYTLASEAHEQQFRESGEPYIIHPLSVACILADLELDIESIVSGLLHDVIEDTEYTYDDVAQMFGQEIADIVDGVTKLDKIEDRMKKDTKSDSSDEQREKSKVKNYREELKAENYRKMFMAMAKDIRVVLLKIADRLHNMRTLKYRAPHKQREQAQETLDIYAPLAHRLGISKLRYELEDLSFKYLNPEAYFDLADQINSRQAERVEYIHKFADDLKQKLEIADIEANVEGRPKHFFSIYKKMKSQDKTLDQIYDLFAVRAIVDSVMDCYEVLGVVHEMYKPIPGKFKDYIAMPKSNMYQSLHTVLMGPNGEPVEVQIRTWEMHRTAEYGIAAHWKYKEGKDGVVQDKEEEKLTWLRQILDWQRDLSDNSEFLKAIKSDLDVFTDHVYCFTPKGEIISILRGSTPVDFAYAIHSAVGNRMIGARVNGSIVTIDYQLNSGDRVEIITSGNSRGPSRDWLKLVKTNQARSKIQQWFKKENKDENIIRGKELLEREAKKKGLSMPELLNVERKAIILNKYGFGDWESLCAAIGHGGVKEGQVVNRLLDEMYREEEQNKFPDLVSELLLKESVPVVTKYKKRSGIVVSGVGDINVRFSKCCTPVPGDEIVGFVTRGRGVSVHRTDCVNVIHLDQVERQRLIDADWQLPEMAERDAKYWAEIRVVCDDRLGMLVDVSRILAEEKIPMRSMNARTIDLAAVFNVGIEIGSREHLDKVTTKLLNLSGVHEVERVTT